MLAGQRGFAEFAEKNVRRRALREGDFARHEPLAFSLRAKGVGERLVFTVGPQLALACLAMCVAALAGCASEQRAGGPALTPAEARALIGRLLPPNIADRGGWAADIHAAFAAMDIAPTPEHICTVVAITEQESTFRTDPPVAGLPTIAWNEIDKQAERVGVPKLVVRTALRVSSPNGKSYADRIDDVKTEKQLSEIF
jgi:hypothetical protein